MNTIQKKKKRQRNIRCMMEIRMVKMLNVMLVILPFMISWFVYYRAHVCGSTSLIRSFGMMVIFTSLYCMYGRIYDAFLMSHRRVTEVFVGQLLAVIMTDVSILFIMSVICGKIIHVLPMLSAFTLQFVFSLGWAKLASKWFFGRFEKQKTAVIYDERPNMQELFIRYGMDRKYDVRTICSVEECLANDMKALEGVDAVFLCGVHSHERNIILKYCVSNSIDTYIIPRIGDVIMSGAQQMHMFHLPILRARRYTPRIEFVIVKRLIDIIVSLMGIVVLSPVMLATAIAIKAHDGGPAIYKQVRLTKNGKEFEILKFRSMRIDAEKDGVARLSSGDHDDRITPIGHIIRKYRLDELPQLFNILSGDMSIVGPRPERPEIAAQYEQEIPEFALRLQATAGLTGYAQVYGKYNTDPYDKLEMDLTYIANPSIWEDLKIMLFTVYTLFAKESTEGVDANQVTALSRETENNSEQPA